MAQFSIKVESKPLENLLRGLPGFLAKGVAAAAVRAGERFVRHHRRERLSAKTVARTGPLVGTGTNRSLGEPPGPGFVGKRTITIQGTSLDNLTLQIQMRSPVALMHEFGRTLTASGDTGFPVPLPAALDARGKASKAARALLKKYGHSRRAAESGMFLVNAKGKAAFGLVAITSKKTGKKFLAKVNPGKKGRERLTLLFQLVPQVEVKARLEFYATWRRFEPKAIEIFQQALPYAIAAAKKKYGTGSVSVPSLPAAFTVPE